eukprot:248995_1
MTVTASNENMDEKQQENQPKVRKTTKHKMSNIDRLAQMLNTSKVTTKSAVSAVKIKEKNNDSKTEKQEKAKITSSGIDANLNKTQSKNNQNNGKSKRRKKTRKK